MALKIYRLGALTFQFEEGEQPAGAVLVETVEKPKAQSKAKAPANKAKKTENK